MCYVAVAGEDGLNDVGWELLRLVGWMGVVISKRGFIGCHSVGSGAEVASVVWWRFG